MKSVGEFRKYFGTVLKPELAKLEIERKRMLKKAFFFCGGILLIWMGVTIPLLVYCQLQMLTLLVTVLGIMAAASVWRGCRDRFVHQFKSTVIAKIAAFLNPELSYSSTGKIRMDEFKRSRIFEGRIDCYNGEDMFEGHIGRTPIRFSEVHAQKKSGGNRNSQHDIFKGLFFVADFSKNFKGSTVVVPDTAERLLGWIGQKIQEMNFMRRGELIKLEDPEFEKLFAVYGTNQITSRYILSPSLMKRMTNFRKRLYRDISFSFVRSKIYVAIRMGRNMFEPYIFRPLVDFRMCRRYFRDLRMALGIVDELNLNRRIWTKA